MDKSSNNRHFCRIWLLASAMIACAWLLPAYSLAASAASTTRVTVTVEDAIGVEYGKPALDSASGKERGQVTTEFITRTGAATGSERNDGANNPVTEILVTVSNL